jgi:hypothetical protein
MICLGACIGVPCLSVGFSTGLWLDDCPATRLRLGADVNANGLVRGQEGFISVSPFVRFMEGEGTSAWIRQEGIFRGVTITAELVDLEDQPVPDGVVELEQTWYDTQVSLKVKVGDLPDGDYKLRVHLKWNSTDDDAQAIDVPLAFYAPALAHVMTDRPLYRPGQEVLLRSVLFRRTDLTPLDGRPGKWHVTNPAGDEMLVERDKAGAFGIADTSFPLDDRAMVGQWTARWESGPASDQVTFDVRPFKLPRFTVDASPGDTWYRINDEIVVEGTAKYSSGAPVANAPVTMNLRVAEGRWPMPLDWEEPFTGKTDGYGKFRIVVGRVPPDLIERSVLSASISVTEAAGETAVGGARVVLSQYDMQVQAVTELGDGLVGGFNNRAYLRVTTPDGRPLPKAHLKVTPWWDAQSAGFEADSDEDGVASFQLDPGDPVTVVIPAPPFRQRPLTPSVPSINSGYELSTGSSFDLAERRALEAAIPAVAACGDYAVGGASVNLGMRVDAGGAVRRVMTGSTLVEQCVADAMQRVHMPYDDERTYTLSWSVTDSLRPWLTGSVSTAWGDASGVQAAFDQSASRARKCLPRGSGISGATVLQVHWQRDVGSKTIAVTPLLGESTGLSPGDLACVRQAFASPVLGYTSTSEGMGTATYSMSLPYQSSYVPQDQAITGYQLRVAAVSDGAKVGEAPIVMSVGSIPALRIRATPTLASPGDELTFELIRGPSYYGELPEELHLMEGTFDIAKAKVDKDARSVKFTVPPDRDGFLYVEYNGARAVVYVRPNDPLSVALSTDKPKYRPGETATLTVTTRAGEAPVAAGVGLVGVDSTLAQLAPLLGPDEYGRITVRETSDTPAFGAFDPKALVLGELRGENAAKAAVLRISTLPMDPAGDDAVYAYARSVDDDVEVLTTSFYRALDRLATNEGTWESGAPAGELMTNEKMAALWTRTLDELDAEGKPAVDAFGRRLELRVLPADLLGQIDPRSMVGDATRLPEDIIDWQRWVAEEQS